MSNANQFYTVKKGDTLSEIAQRNGTTSENLRKINGIDDTDHIIEGQQIALSAKAVCKVTVLLIDLDHNPIPDAKIRIDYNGKRKILTSGACGIVPSIITNSPKDKVTIYIARPNGSWELLHSTLSDWGNKRITCKTKVMKFKSETRPHPKDNTGKPVRDSQKTDKKPVKPPEHPETTEAKGKKHADYGDGKGPKTIPKTNKKGLPVDKVTNDQVKLDCFDKYTGEAITNEDFKWAAKELGVEEAVIRAINEIEAAGKGFVTINKRTLPKFCYERHYFHRLTKGKYTEKNPDISWGKGYFQKGVKYLPTTFKCVGADGKIKTFNTWRRYSHKKDKKLIKQVKKGNELYKNGILTEEKDAYRRTSHTYKRLAKAYALNKEAALQSCSWGAFQIMGSHYATMKYASIMEFVKAMSRSEREHIRAFVKFCKYVKPEVIVAMKAKDFVALAIGYNGGSYADNNYDKKLLDSYKKWRKK